MSEYKHERMVDTRGLFCPEPLMIVRNHVREMKQGEQILVLATDPSTHRDFTNFCRFLGHTLVVTASTNGEYTYVIRKGT